MKLGAFWGLTAPMLVMSKEFFSTEVYEKYVSILNIPGNTVFLTDFQKELKYLLDYIKAFPFTYESAYIDEFNDLVGLTITQGTISSNNTELLYIAYDKLVADVGIKILDDYRKGKNKYSTSKLKILEGKVSETLLESVKEFCLKETVVLDNTKSSVIKILKEFKIDDFEEPLTEDDINALVEQLHLIKSIPDTVIFNENKVKLNSIDKKFLSYLLDSESFIMECIKSVKITKQKEIPIFDTTFHAYVRRKPTSLYYTVLRKFDYAKSTNASYLRTILNEARNDLATLKTCIEDFIIVGREEKEILTDIDYTNIINVFNTDKALFFDSLRLEDYLDVENLLREDLEVLANMYDIVCNLDCTYFSKTLNESIDVTLFNKLDEHMQAIGIYGLNLSSLFLFKDFIKSVMLITTDKIQKTEEQMEELNTVIDNVQALLDSIVEIGGVISV